jgi:hypothetical protein
MHWFAPSQACTTVRFIKSGLSKSATFSPANSLVKPHVRICTRRYQKIPTLSVYLSWRGSSLSVNLAWAAKPMSLPPIGSFILTKHQATTRHDWCIGVERFINDKRPPDKRHRSARADGIKIPGLPTDITIVGI